MCSTFASSIFSSAAPYYGQEFGLSTETTVLGTSLFILGYVSPRVPPYVNRQSLNAKTDDDDIAGPGPVDLGAPFRGIRQEDEHHRASLCLCLFYRSHCRSKGSADDLYHEVFRGVVCLCRESGFGGAINPIMEGGS